MSKALSEGQARSVIESFTLDTPWSEVEVDLRPFIELTPEERGRRFAEFLNNGCQTSITVVAKGIVPEIPEGKKWVEVDGVIYLKVTSNGRSGEEWITYLESKGFRLSKNAKDVLRSLDFKATTGFAYTLAIMRGTLFTDKNRITRKIRAEAEKRGWLTPPAEVGCLLRNFLWDAELEELNLWWVATMHEPINDSDGLPSLFLTNRDGGGVRLDADWVGPVSVLSDRGAFAFLVSQFS